MHLADALVFVAVCCQSVEIMALMESCCYMICCRLLSCEWTLTVWISRIARLKSNMKLISPISKNRWLSEIVASVLERSNVNIEMTSKVISLW